MGYWIGLKGKAEKTESMKILWCWRCRMEIPMLDEDEFKLASKLYSDAFNKRGMTLEERFAPMLEYYEKVTGYKETVPNAIMHHPECENCGKPYRTTVAAVCVACGDKRK